MDIKISGERGGKNMNIGRVIFYNNKTGEVLYSTGDMSGDVIETSVERIMEIFNSENTYLLEDIDIITLEYGFNKDKCPVFINIDTKEIEWVDMPLSIMNKLL